MWMRAAAAALVMLAACRDAPRKDGKTMSNLGPAPTGVRLEFEGVTLGMSLDDALALAAGKGWKHNAVPGRGNQKVTVFPPDGDAIDRYKLGFEAGQLVNIQLEWATADASRVDTLKADYPRTKHGDDGWNMADAGGLTLVYIDDAGKELQALHTGMLRDRREVSALFRMTLGEAPAGGPPLPP